VYDVKRFEHITKYYYEMNILKLIDRRDFHPLIMVYKILYKVSPEYLSFMFVKMSEIHSRNTRSHSLYLQIPTSNLLMFKKSFSVLGAQMWNGLSEKICQSRSLNSFKSQIKKQLLCKYEN
jgi:hypothetical protein